MIQSQDHAATAMEIVELLGEVEPGALERLLATRATIDEVAAAAAALEDEDGFGEVHRGPRSSREAEVRAILEELVFESLDELESNSEIAHA